MQYQSLQSPTILSFSKVKLDLTHTTYFFVVAACLLLMACIQEFEPKTEVKVETQQLASALVVDGLLTDELKNHRIMLTRAFDFEDEGPQAETAASVKVVSNTGTEFVFQETDPGLYVAQNQFAVERDASYTLQINTTDGGRYTSEPVATPPKIEIADLRVERVTSDTDVDGVGIFLDNAVESNDPTYFRYEYEETYKIIAPNWDPFRLIVARYEPCFPDPFVADIEPWEDERRVCFNTDVSKNLIQTTTTGLSEREVTNFQLRFIGRQNYIMSHRYSILVTQYSQTQDAYSFYERLGDFSSSDNLFSQVQPGFLEGNMSSEANSEERVIGYFEVATVNKRRVYFNYTDLFPDEELPPYPFTCGIMGNPRLYPRGYHCADLGVCDGNCNSPLLDQILAGTVVFAAEKEDDFVSPYYTWPAPCGDCTKLGSNVVPEFWVE